MDTSEGFLVHEESDFIIVLLPPNFIRIVASTTGACCDGIETFLYKLNIIKIYHV